MKAVLTTLVIIVAIAYVNADGFGCLQDNNDCLSCIQQSGCGYCGLYVEEGWCVPGDASGSDAASIGGDTECPDEFWRFGDTADTCADPFRAVNITEESDRIRFTSVGVSGISADAAMVDVLYMELSTAPDVDDGHIAARFVLGYGEGDLDTVDYSLFGIAFLNIIEYADPGNNGFDCIDTSSIDQCPSFLEIAKTVELNNFTDITWTEEDGPVEESKVFTGLISSKDGLFSARCVGSNGDYSYEGLDLNAYEWKCDLIIEGWEYVDPTNSLAVQTWIVSLDVVDNLDVKNDTERGNCPSCNMTFAGDGFFKWAPIADSPLYPDGIDVVRNDVHVVNAQADWDPDADVFTTFFSFLGPGATDITWDPTVGYPQRRLDLEFSAANNAKCWLEW